MMVQSTIPLTVIILLAARAVNILCWKTFQGQNRGDSQSIELRLLVRFHITLTAVNHLGLTRGQSTRVPSAHAAFHVEDPCEAFTAKNTAGEA